MDMINEQTTKMSTMVASVSGKVVTSDMYTTYFGDTSFKTFMFDWVPLFSSVIFPVLCLVFVGVGLCVKTESKKRMGERIMRRINIAVRADVRMLRGSSKNVFKGPTSLKDVEKGKKTSPVKGKAEEAAIKQKAAGGASGGKGGRFY